MDETQLRATLRSLQDQITAIEQQLAVPAADPDAAVDFLAGVEGRPAPGFDEVRWRRASDDAVAAEIYSYIQDGSASQLWLYIIDPDGNSSIGRMRSGTVSSAEEIAEILTRADGGGASTNQVVAAAGKVGVLFSALVLNANGGSDLVRKTSWLAAHSLDPEITGKHWGAATPTGGTSGDIAVGTGVIWVNDAGTWKSATVT